MFMRYTTLYPNIFVKCYLLKFPFDSICLRFPHKSSNKMIKMMTKRTTGRTQTTTTTSTREMKKIGLLCTVVTALFLLAVSIDLVSSCNEAVCASIVSKCTLTQSCKCELRNCSCCKECFDCLSYLYSECCSCVGKPLKLHCMYHHHINNMHQSYLNWQKITG